MAAEVWNRLRAWIVGAGSARRIASSKASSQRLATDHSGCSVARGGHLGGVAACRTATPPPTARTTTAARARLSALRVRHITKCEFLSSVVVYAGRFSGYHTREG